MKRVARFLIVLLASGALLAWLAATVVTHVSRHWFEEDIVERSGRVGDSARAALLARWAPGQGEALTALLANIVRDERIMGAMACAEDGRALARTPLLPPQVGCAAVAKRRTEARAQAGPPPSSSVWGAVWDLPGGNAYVAMVPLPAAQPGPRPGFLVLVNDLSFIERREAKTHRFLLVAFGLLAFLASVITIVAARLSWRGFRKELLRFIQGESRRKEFLPIIRDVRELVERIAAEREIDGQGGAWSPQRLKQTLVRHFPGEKVIVLANREPYIHQRAKDGGMEIVHPASGLVAAVEPVLRACSGVWVAHGSGSADREAVDAHDRVRVPPGDACYSLRRLWLSAEEEKGYYYGLANEGLWPLCHLAHMRPIFRNGDFAAYKAVNLKFAEAVCKEADADDPVVLVQDYHFALAPRLIRKRLPRATIISFWHIPWPNSERLGICPWRAELLEGLLGSSIVGFQTQLYCNNFLDSVDRYLEARIDREQSAVVQRGQPSLVRPYPISIAWPVEWPNQTAAVEECRRSVLAELGLAEDALLAVGVDRIDYTKGIEERFLAVERLLERFPAYVGRLTFVQLGAPSRSLLEHYRQLDQAIERTANRINARFARARWKPIHLSRTHHEPPTIYRFYRAADLCYVSSLHDGMNLVAKEFVAARDDERGVLVLSQFTGAARELAESLVVNPYDLEEASSALDTALRMPPDEQRDRMRAMRAFLAEFNVYRWAGAMLVDAARLRRKANALGRSSDDLGRIARLDR
ncbi:MAG: trehalose-6-phosphate synthase [Deltaproteobacteria bacterium]|nr:trehalose-6-phosphate synthase [Deltaproteobacteria bacterium]